MRSGTTSTNDIVLPFSIISRLRARVYATQSVRLTIARPDLAHFLIMLYWICAIARVHNLTLHYLKKHPRFLLDLMDRCYREYARVTRRAHAQRH